MATLKDLSDDIASLVEKASKSVVRVDARRGRAGTGIVWDSGLVLTANHVVEQEDDIQVVADDKSTKATLRPRCPVPRWKTCGRDRSCWRSAARAV